jgi:hypothetical protein
LSSGEYVVTERAVLPVEQAIGLKRDEFSERLGFQRPPKRWVTIAALENGALVETVPNMHLIGEYDCPNDGYVSLLWRHGEQQGPYTFSPTDTRYAPPALFRDDHYAGPAEPAAPSAQDDLPAYLVTTCTAPKKSFNAGALLLSPLVPVAVGGWALADATRPSPASHGWVEHDINAVLASLALGASLPGGLEEWLSEPPPSVNLIGRLGSRTEVGVHARTPTDPASGSDAAKYFAADQKNSWAVKVTLTDGVVTRLERDPWHVCELTAARTFMCQPREFNRLLMR